VNERELIDAANWLRQTMRYDADVKIGFNRVLAERGHTSMDEFADSDPDGFIGIIESLREMTEQIPLEQTRSAGKGKRGD
jgi:hypothetical protein